jgi:hypothetical protein
VIARSFFSGIPAFIPTNKERPLSFLGSKGAISTTTRKIIKPLIKLLPIMLATQCHAFDENESCSPEEVAFCREMAQFDPIFALASSKQLAYYK